MLDIRPVAGALGAEIHGLDLCGDIGTCLLYTSDAADERG